MRMNTHQGKRRLEHGHQKLFADPAEREAGERDSELRRGKISVEVCAHVLGKNRAKVPLIRQLIQLAAADLDDGEFGRHEKGVEDHQRDDHRELAEEKRRWIPTL